MSKLTRAVFMVAAAIFFGGMGLTLVIALMAYVMPAWWQYVFVAVAFPTIASLPIWLSAGVLGVWLKRRRLALSEEGEAS